MIAWFTRFDRPARFTRAAWTTLAVVALGLCAAGGDASAERGVLDRQALEEAARCTAAAPPGQYVDQGIALDYDRLVPQPDPRQSPDTGYVLTIATSTRQLEQVYHDATHGNTRAAWLVCQFEAKVVARK